VEAKILVRILENRAYSPLQLHNESLLSMNDQLYVILDTKIDPNGGVKNLLQDRSIEREAYRTL